MPQLDPQYFLSQLFWLSIFFAFFYLCISKIIIPRLETLFSSRQKLKDDNIREVEKISKEIEKLKAQHIKRGVAVRGKIHRMKEDTNSKFDEYKKSSTEKLNKRLFKEIKNAEEEVANLKNKGVDLGESEALIVSQAQKIINKISGLAIDESDLKKILKENHA